MLKLYKNDFLNITTTIRLNFEDILVTVFIDFEKVLLRLKISSNFKQKERNEIGK